MADRFDPDPLEVVRGSEADIPSLEPLWVAVHHVHEASMPELAPYVSDEETWRERRALYAELFRQAGDVLVPRARTGRARRLRARSHPRLGRVMVERHMAHQRPSRRARIGLRTTRAPRSGIGSALLDAVDAEFARLGVDDQVIGVLPGNVDAIRLYERRGFRPTWLYLSRFAGRDRTSCGSSPCLDENEMTGSVTSRSGRSWGPPDVTQPEDPLDDCVEERLEQGSR